MHLHFERVLKPSSYCDCNLSSLSWMGKVPDGLLLNEEEGWKLNRTNYYLDGWLATGNIRGIVGVTFTTCRTRKNIISDLPVRSNYNLRGHRSEVTLVKWNEPYQKLASCDSSGIIFVWIKYEGRWSIELINDRNTQVTDFCWSHDGRMALICYMDGFVLVGSVSGQRYWSSMLNLDSCTISCGIWSPDDQQVIFGTSSGHILVIDVHGSMVAQVSIQEGIAIMSMSWSCEKFKMEDSDEEQRENSESQNDGKLFALAVSFVDGTIYIMRNYDDLFPIIIRTGMLSIKMEWCNTGDILAIAGHQILNSFVDSNKDRVFSYKNIVQFYTVGGVMRFASVIDMTTYPITAITWGHSDKRLFVATGPVLHIAWIAKRVPSLQLLSRLSVYKNLKNEKSIEELPLPQRLQNTVNNLFGQTLQCYLPDLTHLREFVSSPPSGNARLYCTMIRHDYDIVSDSTSYVLYLEYLGGLVPILKGKRASKLKPEFIIFDPQMSVIDNDRIRQNNSYYGRNNSISPFITPYGTSSDSEIDDPFNTNSSHMRRRRPFRSRHYRNRNNEASNSSLSSGNSSNSSRCDVYMDDMPEYEKLVLVTSNIWGTKFKILGLSSWLPSHLGSITYRTSLLHLQPRQMTLSIKELGENQNSNIAPIDKFENNNNFISSDSEDEAAMASIYDYDNSAPIAPMTPKKNIRVSMPSSFGQTKVISPEKRTTVQFHNFGDSSNNDFLNMSNVSEDMLTLQINGDSQYLSMETSVPSVSSASQCKSTSTQTSFQSITELMNALSIEKNTQTTIFPLSETKTIEEQTEETFSRIAKKFASELPSSYYCVNNKHESLHSPAIVNLNNYSSNDSGNHQSNSNHSISPNVSPPKSIRYKIMKKESPRKASVCCVEHDLTPSRSCDTTSLFSCSPKTQQRYGTSFISSTSSTSSTRGGVSVLHCSNNYATNNDFKFIDDLEGEDNSDLHLRSPSVMFQKNRPICHMQPTIASDFTNLRTGSDASIGRAFTNQRRLTLKKSKQSYSFDMSDTTHSSTDKLRKCMSFEEDDDDNMLMDDENNVEKESVSNKMECNGTPSKTVVTNVTNACLYSCSSSMSSGPSGPSTPIRQKKKTTFNFDNNTYMPYDEPAKCFRSYRLKDESTDTPDCSLSQRFHQHRASLPQACPTSCNSNSAHASSATQILNRSLPASPMLGNQRTRRAQGKAFLYSPMMLRKVMKQKLNYLDCSSEDDNTSDDECNDFRNLESFQKAHIRKRFKVKRRGSRIKPETEKSTNKKLVCCREFTLHNKAPLWNEVSQVYQLDFGGRVTQESAKNFQIEYQGKQVMQFGRIDGNAYTLDFQYPFSALQALAVALANVTQRLK